MKGIKIESLEKIKFDLEGYRKFYERKKKNLINFIKIDLFFSFFFFLPKKDTKKILKMSSPTSLTLLPALNLEYTPISNTLTLRIEKSKI